MPCPFVRRMILGLPLAVLFCVTGFDVQSQEPLKNLQFYAKDLSSPELMQRMRDFSFALGVRCQYCHIGGNGISFNGVVFESDEDPDKVKARFMLRMTENLNKKVLPGLPGLDKVPMEISCKTCHRGQAKPVLLTQMMQQAVDAGGGVAAVKKYRELRESEPMSGSFDFGEWEVNTLAERLAKEGKAKDAILIYELNREFYPRSKGILLALGQLYEASDDIPTAIQMYEGVLEVRPDHNYARQRLEALKKD